eukprot:3703171-Rhodomonas_salina.2
MTPSPTAVGFMKAQVAVSEPPPPSSPPEALSRPSRALLSQPLLSFQLLHCHVAPVQRFSTRPTATVFFFYWPGTCFFLDSAALVPGAVPCSVCEWSCAVCT